MSYKKCISFILLIFASVSCLWGSEPTAAPRVKLSVSAYPKDAGTVEGGGEYPIGRVVEINATAKKGFVFKEWSGVVSDPASPKTTVYVSSDSAVIAHFDEIKFGINAVSSPRHAGYVEGMGTYAQDAPVVLKAVPNEGFVFEGWDGFAKEVVSSSVRFTATRPVTVTARFKPKAPVYTLTLAAAPLEGGTVEGGGELEMGIVKIKAIPAKGYIFNGWKGKVESAGSAETTVSLDGNMTVTANFLRQKAYVEVVANPPEGGSVEGQGTYAVGDVAEIRAIPKQGCVFSEWRGIVGSTNKASMKITIEDGKTKTIIAVFKPEK